MISNIGKRAKCQSCPIQDEAERGTVILMQDEAEILRI